MQFKVVLNDGSEIEGKTDTHEVASYDGSQLFEVHNKGKLIATVPLHLIRYVLFGKWSRV